MFGRRLLVSRGLLLAFFVATQPIQSVLALSAHNLQTKPGIIERITVGTDGFGGGSYTSLSESGGYVVFESAASDLVADGQFGSWDTYLQNRYTHKIERISVNSKGSAVLNVGDYTSPPVISTSGQYVVFMSDSSDLVDNDTNGLPDVFIRDRASRLTQLVSIGVHNAPADGPSYNPVVSNNGQFVAFQSRATNLVEGDNNNAIDVFVRDLSSGKTELVSVNPQGSQGVDLNEYGYPSISISDDGRYIAFSYGSLPIPGQPGSTANSVYLRDRQNKTTLYIAPGSLPSLSPNGKWLAFVSSDALVPDDHNFAPDVYLYNIATQQFQRVSLKSRNQEVTDLSISDPPHVSNDGNYIVFQANTSQLADLPDSASNIYLRDRLHHATVLISQNGEPANGDSYQPAISADGSTIAFNSFASNLVADDNNSMSDVFLVPRSSLVIQSGDTTIFLPIISSSP